MLSESINAVVCLFVRKSDVSRSAFSARRVNAVCEPERSGPPEALPDPTPTSVYHSFSLLCSSNSICCWVYIPPSITPVTLHRFWRNLGSGLNLIPFFLSLWLFPVQPSARAVLRTMCQFDLCDVCGHSLLPQLHTLSALFSLRVGKTPIRQHVFHLSSSLLCHWHKSSITDGQKRANLIHVEGMSQD